MAQKLTIIRGVPGTGKTTKALELLAAAESGTTEHVETDMFFTSPDGTYHFVGAAIKAAHAWCYASVKAYLLAGKNVIVSNTFTRHWEYQQYVDLAKELGIEYEFIVLTHIYGNIHGVPEDKVKEMENRFEY